MFWLYVFVMLAVPKKDVKINILFKGRFFYKVGCMDACTLPVLLHTSQSFIALWLLLVVMTEQINQISVFASKESNSDPEKVWGCFCFTPPPVCTSFPSSFSFPFTGSFSTAEKCRILQTMDAISPDSMEAEWF